MVLALLWPQNLWLSEKSMNVKRFHFSGMMGITSSTMSETQSGG